MGNIISEARKKDVDKKFDREFSSADKALKGVAAARKLDYHENKIKFLLGKFKDTKVTLKVDPISYGEVIKGNQLSVQKTIEANPSISDIEKQLHDHIVEYNTSPATKDHYYTLRSVQNAGSTAFVKSDSCAPKK
ncbi:hypothetical protein V501_02190 [Pseudogymnoascus sp. VKM F-4519 (FW-2642)]|nr:hypothetical protein V501_02190 [Pseudogymnoascus sp. VKM F-4519 (FW-2642)]